jgi:hypothetical protein
MDNSSKPLDQVKRDWSKGNCYYIALEIIKDFPGLVAEGQFADGTQAHLVHGTVRGVKHAWIELSTGEVVDQANNSRIRRPKQEYYDEFSAIPQRRFSREEADAILASIERPEGFDLSWHEIEDEKVAEALAKYEAASAPFARGVIFTDPSDPSNLNNLKLPPHTTDEVR